MSNKPRFVGEKVQVSDAFDLQMGKTPSRKNLDYWRDGDHDWVSIADLGSFDKFVGKTKERINDLGVKDSGIKLAPANTVIMSFKLSLGKTAITVDPVYTNEAIMAFIDKGTYPVDVNFMYHQCKAKDWTSGTNTAVMGKTLNKKTLGQALICLPPLKVQKEIAGQLDFISEQISQAEKQLSRLDQLVKSRFVEMFGDPIANSKNLPIKTWGEVLTIKNGKNQKAVEEQNGPYPICGSGGEIGRASNYLVGANSVIIGRKGNINSPILMREPFWNVDTAFGLEPNLGKLDVDYLYEFCRTFDFARLNKTVTIPSLTKIDLLKIKMPLPNFEDQTKFAAFVAQIDKLRFIAQQQIEKLQTLYDSLAQDYFC